MSFNLGGYVNRMLTNRSSAFLVHAPIGGIRRCHNNYRHSGHSVATAATPSPQRTAEPIQLKVQLGLPTIRNLFHFIILPHGGLSRRPPSSCIIRVPGALLSRTCSSCQNITILFFPKYCLLPPSLRCWYSMPNIRW